MTQAAYCAQCGTNVYVRPQGGCPNGHGPESLSGHYEVPAPGAPAAPAVPSSTVPVVGSPPKSGSKPLVIVLILIGILLLCGLGSCCAALPLYQRITEVTGEESGGLDLERLFDSLEDERLGDADLESEDAARERVAAESAEDLARMVEHFYPWFELDHYYVVDPGTIGGQATFHVIARYARNPEFQITFFARRTTQEDPEGATDPLISYYDGDAAVWWIHPETRERALLSVFGPTPLMTETTLDQIAADFTGKHPGKLITEVSELTNVDLGFLGIDDSELGEWMDDFSSFESVWKLDMTTAPSRFRETSYTE